MRLDLPPAIGIRFARLRRRLWQVESLLTLLAVFLSLGLSWSLVFLLDRMTDTPASLRSVILLTGLACSGLAGAVWFLRWHVRPPDLPRLARLVQRRHRRLGDRLLGMVELADAARRPDNFSPELYAAAIDQVTETALGCDFAQAVSTRRARRLSWAAGTFGLGLLVVCLLLPQAAFNAFLRWAGPHRDVPRHTLIRLENLRTGGVVVHGEPFRVRGEVRYLSLWRPDKPEARFGRERPLPAVIRDGMLEVEVPPQHDPKELTVRLGDATARLATEPVFRPKLLEFGATARLPGYLRRPDAKLTLSGGTLEVLEGSRVSLQGETSRTLEGATLDWGEEQGRPLEVEGPRFSGAPLPLEGIHRATLGWRDELGLVPTQPWSFAIRQLPDRPPSIGIEGLGTDNAVLDSEVLAIPVTVRDDFGVDRFGLSWEIADGTAPPSLPPDEFHDSSVNRSQPELDVNFYFSPALYGLEAGTTIAFRGFVTDFLPGRDPVLSPVHRVHVVSSAQHAEWVRQRLEDLLANLEEIGWLQESLKSSAEGILDNPDLDPEVAGNRLRDQLADQLWNAGQLEELTRRGAGILREAMRNARFSDAIMDDWSGTLAMMQALASRKMPQASGQLSLAAGRPQERREHVEAAAATQEEILEDLRNMQNRINRDLDTMEAMTLADRLRTLGREETRIEEALMAQAADIIGLLPEELAPRFRAANRRLTGDQSQSSRSARILQEEIGRFHERTGMEAYGEVSREMKDRKVAESLQDIGDLIERNISMQATEKLAGWAVEFEEWADIIDPPEEEGEGGGGDGSGEGGDAADLTRELMALLRLRERELTLRHRTELIHRKREDLDEKDLLSQAADLSRTQREIRERLDEVSGALTFQDILTALLESRNHMDTVTGLLREGAVDEPAIDEEKQAIDDLTDAINLILEQARQGSPGQSRMARQMAMMLQMAATGPGNPLSPTPSASGNPGGGSTDRTPEDVEGDTTSRPGAARSRQRTSGLPENLPAEFRGAMETYFRELDRIEPSLGEGIAP